MDLETRRIASQQWFAPRHSVYDLSSTAALVVQTLARKDERKKVFFQPRAEIASLLSQSKTRKRSCLCVSEQ